ncbi:hypothetical protein ABZ368_24525 [Streptomyces sp. NPDC005908]|uniref:cupin domain-containing protein n=1 Tax=unclassified Streptomyces TaxID=2593676 RepID=UPI0011A115C3|nr:cupin domain-containing protein [Streptomyces sp. T12]TWD19620.1 hypothetical protein FB570_108346 [Streptomyces sp. T12]
MGRPQALEPACDHAVMDAPGELSGDGIFHLRAGELLITLDGTPHRIAAGDTVIVNAGGRRPWTTRPPRPPSPG